MLDVNSVTEIHLACGSTDLRKSVDGLALIVQEQFKLNPFSSSLFAFCNKPKDRLKILHWDHNGFWIYYRRLENGKFKWPQDSSETSLVTLEEFRQLLDGWPITRGKAHKKVSVEIV